jgi:hypothetical protein
MGASIAIDLRKSFAMSAKGPASMLGKTSKRGSVITDEYHDAEADRVAEQKAAAKRQPSKDKSTPRKTKSSSRKDKPKGGKRPDKRQRYEKDEGHWGHWVFPDFSDSRVIPCLFLAPDIVRFNKYPRPSPFSGRRVVLRLQALQA